MQRIREKNINTSKYWDNLSTFSHEEGDRKRGGNLCKFSTVKNLIAENLDMLDVGCYSGNFYNFLKENNFSVKSFMGVDHSKNLIARAKIRFPEQKWCVSDCHKLPFEDNSFDIVSIMEVLEHIENPEEALKEIKRVCRKNGTVIVTTPNELRVDDPEHIWSYTISDIFNFLSKISSNTQILLTCSNNRTIIGKAIIDFDYLSYCSYY